MSSIRPNWRSRADVMAPKSLTKEQELDLVARAKQGDAEAVSALMLLYTPLIKRKVAGYRFLDALEHEDLMSQCYIYLGEAIKKFDLEKDNKFGTFLVPQLLQLTRYVIENGETIKRPATYLKDIKESDANRMCTHSMDKVLNQHGDTYVDTIEDREYELVSDVILEKEQIGVLYEALEFLDDVERELIMRYHMYQEVFYKICESMNLRPDYARPIMRNGLHKLRMAMDKLAPQ